MNKPQPARSGFDVFEPWKPEPEELGVGQPGPPEAAGEPEPEREPPGELVGVGGGARTGLSRQAAGKPVANGRPDTLPDWRPGLSSHRPPAAADADADFERPRGLDRVLSVRGWPLAIILAIQAALSLRLVWSATAFIDEGEYLTIGHLELDHFLHHAAMPEVASFLSGSPVVYPPLAAIADNIGGLAAARLLSLAFMLVTTVGLHGVTRRLLSSRTAAFFAAALFAGLGSAQFLSAFATYDAMALMLLALATWCGVRAAEASSTLRLALICAGGLSMAVADAAKYASVLFNPVVLAVVALAAWRADGRKAGLDTGGGMLLAAALPLTVGYDLGGSSYKQGLTSTTLTRAGGTDSVRSVLDLSAHATGIIAVLAVLGAVVVTARRPGWPTVALAWTLAAAEFLAPAEQARIHTLTSLFKHVGYGAWFACVIAGYLLAELPALLASLNRSRRARAPGAGARSRPRWALAFGAVVGTAAVLAAGVFGVTVADGQYGDWADSRPMIADLAGLVQPGGRYLVEDPSVVTYYLRSKIPYQNVYNTFSFSYPDPQTGQVLANVPAYAQAIKQGYFSAVVLSFGDTYGLDLGLVQDMSRDHDYRLVDVIRYRTSYGASKYEIWQRVDQRQPAANHQRAAHRRRRRR